MSKPRLPSSYSTGRRWTEAEARTVLAAQVGSGLSIEEFGRREGFNKQRLYSWKRRLAGDVAEQKAGPDFVEMLRSPTATIEIVLRSGRILRVPESCDGASLARLIAALDPDVAC